MSSECVSSDRQCITRLSIRTDRLSQSLLIEEEEISLYRSLSLFLSLFLPTWESERPPQIQKPTNHCPLVVRTDIAAHMLRFNLHFSLAWGLLRADIGALHLHCCVFLKNLSGGSHVWVMWLEFWVSVKVHERILFKMSFVVCFPTVEVEME